MKSQPPDFVDCAFRSARANYRPQSEEGTETSSLWLVGPSNQNLSKMHPAFTGPALPRATRTLAGRHATPKCSLPEVEKNYPLHRRSKAPVISFNGDQGVRVSLERIAAFAEIDADTPPLLDYSDPGAFVPSKPTAPSAISWPAGDGRGMELSGDKGNFTQADLKKYGPFPDFFKVSLRTLFMRRRRWQYTLMAKSNLFVSFCCSGLVTAKRGRRTWRALRCACL